MYVGHPAVYLEQYLLGDYLLSGVVWFTLVCAARVHLCPHSVPRPLSS